MEYVIVTFSETREVIIDGENCGSTGDVLEVEKGTHRIQLGGDQNYTPKWRRATVEDTTFVEPMEVTFEPA